MWEGKALTVTYRVTTERVQILHSGLRRSTEEIELARLKDVQVEQSLAQRAMRTGDITIISSDATTPSITFREVSDPEGVKEKIRTAAREELERLTVQSYTPT